MIAGYGSGKTTSDVFLLLSLIERYFDSPIKIGVMGITITLLRKTLIGDLIKFFISTGLPYAYDKQENIVRVGAVELVLIAIEQPSSIYAHNFSISIVDELDELEFSRSIDTFKAVQERTRTTLPDGRKPFSVFTTTAQGFAGTYSIIETLKEQKQKFVKIQASTKDNTSLDADYVKRLYAIYDENERLAFLEGYFVALNSGRVYGDYNPTTDLVPDIEIDPQEDIYIGQDFNAGWSKGCAFVKRDKVLYAVDNFSFVKIGDAPGTIRSRFPNNEIYWFPDTSSKELLAGYSSEIMNEGIHLRMGDSNPSISERVLFVNKMLKTGHLKICKKAKELDTALRVRQFDANTGKPEKGKGSTAPDHIADAAEYCVVRLVSMEKDFLDLWQLSSTARMGGKKNYPVGNGSMFGA
jgi:hypothetical protein